MSVLVALAFIAIVGSLGAALYFMLKGGSQGHEQGRRMARALAIRIALSVLVFACVLIAWKFGYLRPTGLPLGR